AGSGRPPGWRMSECRIFYSKPEHDLRREEMAPCDAIGITPIVLIRRLQEQVALQGIAGAYFGPRHRGVPRAGTIGAGDADESQVIPPPRSKQSGNDLVTALDRDGTGTELLVDERR